MLTSACILLPAQYMGLINKHYSFMLAQNHVSANIVVRQRDNKKFNFKEKNGNKDLKLARYIATSISTYRSC